MTGTPQKTYPRVWLIWDWALRRWADNVFDSEEHVDQWIETGDEKVQLVPLPEFERLIAMERCAAWHPQPTASGVWIEAVGGKPRRLVTVFTLDQPWPSSSKWFGPIPEVPQ